MKRFEQQIAVVTGAGSGIGREICRRVANDGCAVAAIDIDEASARATADQITGTGGRAIALACDVSDSAQVNAAIECTVAELGPPSMLFNVAGMVRYARVENVDLAMFNRVLAINLTGAFLMSQAVLPHLVATRGSIVNVSSMAGHLGIPYASAYSASKGALVAMSKSMAKEFADRGVRVNVLAPGGVETPMFSVPFPEDANELVMRLIPMSPIGVARPTDIAATAAFVASNESGNLSGALIPIDGAST